MLVFQNYPRVDLQRAEAFHGDEPEAVRRLHPAVQSREKQVGLLASGRAASVISLMRPLMASQVTQSKGITCSPLGQTRVTYPYLDQKNFICYSTTQQDDVVWIIGRGLKKKRCFDASQFCVERFRLDSDN